MEAKNQAAQFKRAAAARALDEVAAGMRLGLGTGSTANVFVELLGERVRAGLSLRCVATSEATAALAQRCGIRIETLDELPELDLAVDGADEVGPGLALIKGGGGALLREKIVAAAARTVVIIVDESKVVPVLGRFALPIEVVPFGAEVSRRAIARIARELGLSGEIRLRRADGHVFVTDGGHWIFDAGFGAIPDPAALAAGLSQIPGVVEHGLFIALASQAIVAGPAGVRVLTRQFQG